MFKCIPKQGLTQQLKFHFSCRNGARSATSGTVARGTWPLPQYLQKLCSFILFHLRAAPRLLVLLLGYPACKIPSLFWSAPCNSYTRLQCVSFSCWFITNSNLRSAPTLWNGSLGSITDGAQGQGGLLLLWSPAAAESHGSPPPPRAGKTRAGQLGGPGCRLLLPQIPPGQGGQHATGPFPDAAAPGVAGGRGRTGRLFPGQRDLGSRVRAANRGAWPPYVLDASLPPGNALGERYC